MPALTPARRKQALGALSFDRLRGLADHFGLEVSDRRIRAAFTTVLADARRVAFPDVLARLSRNELKDICEALGLDTGGRAKQRIIDRILADGAAPTAKGRATRRPRKHAAPSEEAEADEIEAVVAEVLEQGPDAKLTREQLEGYLWAAADILRGSIDSSDYKNFIFGLLFLKRLSDRFEEECEELVKEGEDPEDPVEHPFFVPKRARWPEIQKAATGLGEVLNKATAALEDANPTLEGVLRGIDYNDERKLGDTKQRDTLLHRLVQHFSGLVLRNDHLSEPDMLGRAYEYLIEKFADDAGKKGGEFYTPHMVVRLIVELLEPEPGMRLCDPTAGSGGMLIQCAKHIQEQSGGQRNLRNFSLYGQEKNLGTWAICKMNLLLHGFPDARIEKGDTIRSPKLLEDGELMLFDHVIANPPFSLDNWGKEVAENDPHGRFRFGVPPKTKGDLAFFQHMVATLNGTGKMGIVMPHGVLFRGSTEGKIRQGLLQEDLIEAVVGLPSNLFYGTGIPAAVIVVNRAKPEARKGKVIFVEASREFREGSNQNHLRDEDVSKIAATAHAFEDVERYARVVAAEEIEKNDFNLNISRYVDTAEAQKTVNVASAVKKLRKAEEARDEAKAVMDRFLLELGF